MIPRYVLKLHTRTGSPTSPVAYSLARGRLAAINQVVHTHLKHAWIRQRGLGTPRSWALRWIQGLEGEGTLRGASPGGRTVMLSNGNRYTRTDTEPQEWRCQLFAICSQLPPSPPPLCPIRLHSPDSPASFPLGLASGRSRQEIGRRGRERTGWSLPFALLWLCLGRAPLCPGSAGCSFWALLPQAPAPAGAALAPAPIGSPGSGHWHHPLFVLSAPGRPWCSASLRSGTLLWLPDTLSLMGFPLLVEGLGCFLSRPPLGVLACDRP